MELREPTPATEPSPATEGSVAADVPASSTCTGVISLPWTAQAFPSVKGVLHQPETKPMLKADAWPVITAVAAARASIEMRRMCRSLPKSGLISALTSSGRSLRKSATCAQRPVGARAKICARSNTLRPAHKTALKKQL